MPATTLASAITTTTGTAVSVASVSGFPTSNFRIVIDGEIMLVSSVVGTTLTVVRGYEQTTAATHLVSASVTLLSSDTAVVTLAEAKEYCRITGTQDDITLTALIAAAVDYLERRTNLRLLTTQLTAIMDAFPAYPDITLPTAPLMTVDSIIYLDSAGASQTLAASDYTVDTSRRPGRVVADDAWPATQAIANAVTITYTAGFAAVPEVLKLAAKMLVSHWYDNRGQATEKAQNEIPLAIGAIIDNHAVRLAQG